MFEGGKTWADDVVAIKIWTGVKSGHSKAFSSGRADFFISDRYASVINTTIQKEDSWPNKLSGSVPINSVVTYGVKIIRCNDGRPLTVQGVGLALANANKEENTISGTHPVGHKLTIEVTGLYPLTTDDAKLICNLREEVTTHGLEHVQAILTGIVKQT